MDCVYIHQHISFKFIKKYLDLGGNLRESLSSLPDYPFERLRDLLRNSDPISYVGVNNSVVDMSIGAPKHGMPSFFKNILEENFCDYGLYPPVKGTDSFIQSVKEWVSSRFSIPFDTISEETSITPLCGTKEGMFISAMSLTDDLKGGDNYFLIPNPFYQCYGAAAIMAGCIPFYMPTTKNTGFLPDFSDISPDILNRTKVVFICSPSNPQGSVASKEYWKNLLELSDKYGFYIFSDECYTDIYDKAPPPGVVEVVHETGRCFNKIVSFYSLSKRSSVPGLRSGFALSGHTSSRKIQKLKSYGGSVCPIPTMKASEALWKDENHVKKNREIYHKKYEFCHHIFSEYEGYTPIKAGFFLWLQVQECEQQSINLWKKFGIKTLPGKYLYRDQSSDTYNEESNSFLRIALVEELPIIKIALEKIADELIA